MPDSRLPLTIRPVPGGFSIVFADGGQHVFVQGQNPFTQVEQTLSSDQTLDLAREIAGALMAAWGDPLRSAA
jgi:hypothetical protein